MHPAASFGERTRQRRYHEILEDPPRSTLQAIRRSVGLSQAQVAAHLGVTQLAVSRLETRPNPTVRTLAAYIEAVGGSLQIIVRLKRSRRAVAVDFSPCPPRSPSAPAPPPSCSNPS